MTNDCIGTLGSYPRPLLPFLATESHPGILITHEESIRLRGLRCGLTHGSQWSVSGMEVICAGCGDERSENLVITLPLNLSLASPGTTHLQRTTIAKHLRGSLLSNLCSSETSVKRRAKRGAVVLSQLGTEFILRRGFALSSPSSGSTADQAVNCQPRPRRFAR